MEHEYMGPNLTPAEYQETDACGTRDCVIARRDDGGDKGGSA